jgi:hypothetical protein
LPLVVFAVAVGLFALGAFVIVINQLSACGGDGGSAHALPGSPQLSYCNSNLELLALAAPFPLLVEWFRVRRGWRHLSVAALVGLFIAATPIIAAYVLTDV